MTHRIVGIRILEKENNKQGDLFTRLMKDVLLTLGYDNPRFNTHKTGREIDILAEHRTENKMMIAECKSGKKKSGGDDINKFYGVWSGEQSRRPVIRMEGYFFSLSGFTSEAEEMVAERTGRDRMILVDMAGMIDALVEGRIIVSPVKAMEQAARCAAGFPRSLRAEESFTLLAHESGWLWLVYFGENKKRSHFVLVHADGEALAAEPAQAVIDADKAVNGDLHRLDYLNPPCRTIEVEERLETVRTRYLDYLQAECGDITLEGMPADQDAGERRMGLEKLFVPLHLAPSHRRQAKGMAFGDAVEQEIDNDIEDRDTKEERKRLPVGRVLEEVGRLAILAAPGGGKTTLLKRLAVAYAFPERRKLSSDGLPDREWLPLFIRCRQLGESVTAPILDILCTGAARAEMGDAQADFAELVNRALRSGNVLLLVDGLDEIAGEKERLCFVTQLRTFLATYPVVNVVVTSREAGFRIVGGALSAYCRHYTIGDFDEDDIVHLTLAWHNVVMGNKAGVEEEARKLAEVICKTDRVRRLAANPLLLTTLLLVKRWVGQLPTRRSVLYGKAVEVLLMTWNAAAHEPMDQEESIPQLAFVAYEMMKEGIQRISGKRLKELLYSARKQMPEVLGYARYSVSEFIERVEYRSSLLIQVGHVVEQGTLYPMYEFHHLTFQEYLTARAVVEGYYPNRKETDTLLSLLESHINDGKWQEVIPLSAVLAGRNVQPLFRHLIECCKNSDPIPSNRYSKSTVILLAQCILDEIQVAPQLLAEALEWIARRTFGPSELCVSIYKSKYGEMFEKVVRESYISTDRDLSTLGSALAEIQLYKMGRYRKVGVNSSMYKKIKDLLKDDDSIQKSIGALAVMHIAYYGWKPRPYPDKPKRLKSLGNLLIPALNSEVPYLHFAACWAFAWLGSSEAWTPEFHPKILPRLLELRKKSPLPDVQSKASWAIVALPVLDRALKPLPEPDEDLIEFVKELYSKGIKRDDKTAALAIAFYWKKIWTDKELAEKINNTNSPLAPSWERNKLRMLKQLRKKGKPTPDNAKVQRSPNDLV